MQPLPLNNEPYIDQDGHGLRFSKHHTIEKRTYNVDTKVGTISELQTK